MKNLQGEENAISKFIVRNNKTNQLPLKLNSTAIDEFLLIF